MSAQADLFERPALAGMAEAASHASPADLEAVRQVVTSFAAGGEPFTSEDCIGKLTDAQCDRLAAFPNALGGLFFCMQRQRLIEKQGAVKATRPEARGRWLTLWRGRRASDA